MTIFGESAGGHNVLALLASPLAEGLFHKAISQSGYTLVSSVADAYNEAGANSLVERGGWQIANQIVQGSQSDYSAEALRSTLKSVDAREFIGLYYREGGAL